MKGKTVELNDIVLQYGKHAQSDDGLCLMEAVAYIAGEPHSDRPACACPALTTFGVILNDRMTTEERQRLKPLIPKLIGTRDGKELERAKILAWAAVTEFAPAALRAVKLDEHAAKLEALPKYDWEAARKACGKARTAACAAANAASAASYAANASADAAASYAAYAASAAFYAAYADAYAAASYAAAAASAAAADAADAAASYASYAANAAACAATDARAKIINLAHAAFERATRVQDS